MINKKSLSAVISLTLLAGLNSQPVYANFTGSVGNYSKDFVIKKEDQSAELNRLIKKISKQENGGTISIPAGEVILKNIQLASNVHIKIDKDTVIRVFDDTRKKIKSKKKLSKVKLRAKKLMKKSHDYPGITVFNLGETQAKSPIINNVKIYCGNCTDTGNTNDVDNYYTIDLVTDALTGKELNNKGMKAFGIGKAENFWVSDWYVADSESKFSAMSLNPTIVGPDDHQRVVHTPKNGVIKNANISNALYGYGLIQAQSGQNILFENLHGEGGVTLRMESGAGIANVSTLDDIDIGAYNNITAKNINGTNCKAALMMSPHGRIHKKVSVDGVTAHSCGYAVKISGGFRDRSITDENGDNIDPTRFKKGYFEGPVEIKNVYAEFGHKAQQKSKDFPYVPKELADKKPFKAYAEASDYTSSIDLPSIAAVGYHSIEGKGIPAKNDITGNKEGTGQWEASISNVSGKGFPQCVVKNGHISYKNEKGNNCK